MNSAPFRVLLALIFTDMVTQGLAYPSMPALIMQLGNTDLQGATALYGWLIASYALAELIGAPTLGLLSDRFGRKPILIVSTASASVSFLVSAVAPNLPILFLGYFFAGLTSAMMVVANSAVADLTSLEDRGKAFAYLGAVVGVGFIVGPAMGAVVEPLGLRAPFFIGSGAMALCSLAAIFFMRETRRAVSDAPAVRLAEFLPWNALRAMGRNPIIKRLAWTAVLNVLALQMLISVWVPYTTYRYGFGPGENGLLLAAFGLAMALSQGLIAPRLLPKFGNVTSIKIGFTASVLSYIAYGWAPTWQWLLVLMFIGALAALDEPAMQAVVTDLAGENEQGAVQGGFASITSLMGIVGPIIGTKLFGAFTGERARVDIPGITFFAGAALVIFAAWNAVIALRSYRPRPVDTSE